MGKFDNQSIQLGEAFELSGAFDRQKQIELTLDRLKRDRIKKAEIECQKLIDQARQEAADILELARQKAHEIIQDGENRRGDVLNQAYQEGEAAGFQKGYEDGHQKAETETIGLLKSAQTVLQGAYDAQKRVLKGFERDAIELVRCVCRHILRREMATSPEALIALIETAVETLNLSGRIRVVMSLEALNTLQEYSRATRSAMDRLTRLELETDPMLETHEIYVLSERGNFVLTPDTQVDVLLQPLQGQIPLEDTVTEEKAASEGLPGDVVPEEAVSEEAVPEEAPEPFEPEFPGETP